MTSDTSSTTLEQTIDTYLQAYGEPDAAMRRQLISAAWATDGTLTDPPFEAGGHDALDQTFAAVQAQFPGHRFARTTAVDAHHGVARYGWELRADDGAVAVAGMDVARVGDDGRLTSVTGFFGDLAPLAV